MKKSIIMLALLVIVISGCRKHETTTNSSIWTPIAKWDFATINDNTLTTEVILNKDSTYTLKFTSKIKKTPLEDIEVRLQYGNQTLPDTMKFSHLSGDYMLGKTTITKRKSQDNYTVSIYSKSEIGGTVVELLIGEIKFLHPKNGLFEEIYFMEQVHNVLLNKHYKKN